MSVKLCVCWIYSLEEIFHPIPHPKRERERERKKERKKKRERQRDRKKERERERKKERYRDILLPLKNNTLAMMYRYDYTNVFVNP